MLRGGHGSAREAVAGGILATLAIHFGLLWLVPMEALTRQLSGEVEPLPARELSFSYLAPKTPPDTIPPRFVEANPEVSPQPPDDSPNFAARDQQSAQPDPQAWNSPDRVPNLEGEEPDSPKIVESEFFREENQEPLPPGVYALSGGSASGQGSLAPTGYTPSMPKPRTPPAAPDFLEAEVAEGEGLATWLSPGPGDKPEGTESEPAVVDLSLDMSAWLAAQQGEPGSPGSPGSGLSLGQGDHPAEGEGEGVGSDPRPLPRVRLSPRVAPGPLRHHAGGVTRSGAIAIDANFAEYGDYLQRMFDAISLKWNQLNYASIRSYQEMNSRVLVEFNVTRDGTIKDLRVIMTTADRLRTLFCEDAILSRAPYGPWTADMVRVLGEVQPVRITFIYR